MMPALLLDRPAAEGVRWLALGRLQEWRAARRRLDDSDDDEGLHDFRVALRRLRVLLRVYRGLLGDSVTRRSRRRLSRLASRAGPSRDSEVRLGWLRAHASAMAADHAGVRWVERKLARDRARGDRRLRRTVTREFDPLLDELGNALQQYPITFTLGRPVVVPTMREVTAAALHALAADVGDAAAAAAASGDADLNHRTRIAARRLRYLLEPLVDRRLVSGSVLTTARGAIAQLRRMQDAFGDLHDVVAFDLWLAECDRSERGGQAEVRAYVERLRQRLQRSAARRQRALDGPAWHQRIAAIVEQGHRVADGLVQG